MFVFNGEVEHSLDDKGRVIIPSKYRDHLNPGYYLTKGLDGCLWLFTADTWSGLSAKLFQSSIVTDGARQLDRMLFSGSEGKPDGAGRLTIPASLREFARIEAGGPVVIVGVKNRIELWEPERWRRMNARIAQDSDFAKELAGLGI